MAIKHPSQILIRRGCTDDQLAVLQLAVLDSAAVPPSPLLVAELDGELKVALSLQDGSVIADPFTYTADVVSLLAAHAAAERTRVPVRRHRSLRPRVARRQAVLLRS
jgi:hypothetical protein